MNATAKTTSIRSASRFAPHGPALRAALIFAVCALFATALLPSVTTARPAGWDRHVHGPAGPSAPLDCAARAQALKTEYDVFQGLRERLGANAAQDLFRIRKEWANLKVECPDIGSLDPDKPDLPPNKDLKTDEWKEMMEDEAKQLDQDAFNEEQYAKSDDALFGKLADKVPLVGWAAAGHEQKAAQDREQAKKIRDLIKDPPSSDYGKVVEVKPIAEAAATDDKTEAGKVSSAALKAQRLSSQYIQAYTTSYERYQGAKEARDAGKMRLQAAAMVNFALAAQQASQSATLHWYEFEKLLDSARKEAEDAAAKKGVTFEDALAEAQKRLESDGFSPESRKAMGQAGIPEEEIDAFRKRLLAFTPKEIEDAQAKRKLRLAADEAIRKALADKNSKAAWPQPPDILALESMEYGGRDLYRQMMQTHIELSFQGPKGADAGKPAAPVEAGREPPTWWAVPAGEAPRLTTDTLIRSPVSDPLAPGKYDVYLAQSAAQIVEDATHPIPSTVCVARGVLVEEGKPSAVVLRTGLGLQLAKGAPKPLSWFVLPSDAGFTTPVAQRDGGSTDLLWLVPGKYDVYYIQSAEQRNRPLLLARAIAVKEGELAPVLVEQTEVGIQLASWAALPDKDYGWWGLVQSGDAPAYTLIRSPKAEKLSVPPGTYDFYWVQDYDHRDKPLLLAEKVELKANTPVALPADSGIQLQTASWVPIRDKDYGWWGVTAAGEQPSQRIQWSKSADALLLPPGKYNVYWVQDYDHKDHALLLHDGVQVKSGARTTVTADSGIQLQTASWVPARDKDYAWWGVTAAGEPPSHIIHWSNTADALLLPPGKYDVYWLQDYDHRDHVLLLHDGVQIKSGARTTVAADCGIRLKVPPGAPKLDADYGWWGVVPTGDSSKQPIQWVKGKWDQPLLVRPGAYDVIWKQNYERAPEIIRKGVVVEAPKDQEKSAPIEVEVQFPAAGGPK